MREQMTRWYIAMQMKMKNFLEDFAEEEKGAADIVAIIMVIVGNFTPYLGCVLCGQSGNVWTNLTRYTEKGGKCV